MFDFLTLAIAVVALIVIALTIGKAFLVDMSTLNGAYRALSFMGPGAGGDRLAVPAGPVSPAAAPVTALGA